VPAVPSDGPSVGCKSDETQPAGPTGLAAATGVATGVVGVADALDPAAGGTVSVAFLVAVAAGDPVLQPAIKPVAPAATASTPSRLVAVAIEFIAAIL
jgi:hypothetical protein